MRTSCFILLLLLAMAPLTMAGQEEYSTDHTIYWSENWEAGIGYWYASNGVWDVGVPVGGTTAHQGSNCLATNIVGNYPDNVDSRFISPSIQLPADPQDGVLWLRFWHFFRLADSDLGYVQISVDGGDFVTVSKSFASYSSRWSPYILDITEYAGQNIRLGIFFNEGGSYEEYGWYLDQLEILGGHFEWVNPEGFERHQQSDIQYDGWYTTNGIWEIGIPTVGPQPNSGHFCAGTVLSGNYPDDTYSGLISPFVTLPSNPLEGELWLSFMQWFSLADYEYGEVYIYSDDTWIKLAGNFDGSSGLWTEFIIDLSPYLGQTVCFEFMHREGGSYEESGWYVDDISIVEGPKVFNNPSTFEGGSRGWYSTQGVWEVGIPTYGPSSAYSGEMCWGTRLGSNFPDNNSSNLLTPKVQLPAAPEGDLILKFQHWFSYADYDYGQVWIYPEGGEAATISSQFSNSSNGWGQYLIDLIPYAGQTVSFGFNHHEGGSYEAPGWYIDDVEIIGMDQSTVPAPLFVYTNYSPTSPAVSWFYLPYDPAYTAVYYSREFDVLPNLGNRIAMLTDDAMAYSDGNQDGWDHFYKIGLMDGLGHEGIPMGVTAPPAGVDGPNQLPTHIASLGGNVPNPFNPITSIKFTVHNDTHVILEVFDVRGHKISTLVDREMEKGDYSIPFTPKELSSGTYLCRLTAGGIVLNTKMTLLR